VNDAETWTLQNVDQKQLGKFCNVTLERVGKISLTDRVRNEEVLLRVKEQRNIVQTIKRRKTNWIGHILRRNCLLKHVIEGKVKKRSEGTTRKKTYAAIG
jgi:hypothetical protein